MHKLGGATPVVLVFCLLAGCDDQRGTRLALSTGANREAVSTSPPQGPPPPGKNAERAVAHRYQGKTAGEWGKVLDDKDSAMVQRATRALYVLGAVGRPYLVQGLESSNPEARRMCLESLSLSDLRLYGDEGRRLLVKLTGDTKDVRIRQRASVYLQQWNDSIPSAP